MMRRSEYTDQLAFDRQGNGHLRARVGLTSDVIRVHADVRCVTHLAGCSDVADEPLFADLEAMPLMVQAAPVHTRQHHLALFRLVQEHIDLRASVRSGDVVYNFFYEIV